MPTLNCFSSKFCNRKVTKSVTLVALLYLPDVFAKHHSTVYSSTGETKTRFLPSAAGRGKEKRQSLIQRSINTLFSGLLGKVVLKMSASAARS